MDLSELSQVADPLRDKLKAMLICFSQSWGGLEQVAAQDAVELSSQGLDVGMIVLDGSPIHQTLDSCKEVKLLPIGFRPRNNFDLKLRSLLHELIGKESGSGVNLFHTHQTSILGSIVPWLWGHAPIALFATRHIMNDHNKRDFYHRAIYSRLDSLLVMSRALRRNVLDTHAIREPRVRVVSLGLDFEKFDPTKVDPLVQRAKWGVEAGTTVIGLVGRIDPAKGQGTFIRAAAGLMKNRSPDEKLKFVIVGEETLGSEGGHYRELLEMVRQFHLEESVVFAGFQADIPQVMRAFDIFVMPSRQEAFGLVAIEAMAMECPVIISKSGSSEEIVGDEQFGLTVRPDDAFDLQGQIRFLLDNPGERYRMGKSGRDHVVRNYDRRMRVLQTLDLYSRALKRRGVIQSTS